MKAFLRSIRRARRWEDCYPLGNGTIGVMDNCAPVTGTVWLNDEGFWSGVPNMDKANSGGKEALEEIRECLKNEDFKTAQDLVKEKISGKECESYIPIGKLNIYKGWGIVRDYHRKLDLNTAVMECEYSLRENQYKEESFVSYPDKIYAKKITSENKSIIKLQFDSRHPHKIGYKDKFLWVEGYAPDHVVFNGLPSKKPIVYSENGESIKFAFGIKFDTDAQVIYFTENGVRLANATYVIMYYTSITDCDKEVANVEEVKKVLDKALEKGYEACKQDHIEDYKKLFDRVEFELNGVTESPENLDKALRLVNKTGEGLDALICTLYAFGRYITIASSREGSKLPSNLQGIWNKSYRPKWNSAYTTNINLQMNYWPVDSANLSECGRPFVNFVKALCEDSKVNTPKVFGCDGFATGHNSDIWAQSAPIGGETMWSSASYSLCMGASGWLTNQIFDMYRYNLDDKFLKDDVLPVMEECVKFYLDFLYEDEKTGRLLCGPDISPENSYRFNGGTYSIDVAPEFTIAIIRELFVNYLLVIKEENDYTKRIKNALPKLGGYNITSEGRIAEWSKNYEEAEPHHRHVSHLYGLYPGLEINKDTPKLMAACRESLKARGEGGTGWSLAWKICLYARLGEGDKCLEFLKKQFSPVRRQHGQAGGSYGSLLSAHPPYQIDGNFGTLAGINEMLIQSDGENTFYLPALPASWKEGKIKGIRVRGNKTVNLEWKDGKVISAEIN